MSHQSLTVIGATGTLSVPVIKQLINKGVSVTAVVRNVEKARTLLPEETEIVYGDVEDKESLIKALRGSEHVYVHLNTTSLDANLSFHPEREGVRNIVAAAEQNQVKQLIQIGGIESLRPEFSLEGRQLKTSLIREQGMSYLKESNIAHTFLLCSFFVDSFPVYIQERTFALFGNLKHSLYFTNTHQLANSILNAIGNPETFNRSFAIQGKEGMSFPEAARRFIHNFNPDITIEHYPIEAIRQMGLPEEQAEFMEHMMLFVDQLAEQPIQDESWKILGAPKLSFDEFVKQLK